jgi:hypothetical protein
MAGTRAGVMLAGGIRAAATRRPGRAGALPGAGIPAIVTWPVATWPAMTWRAVTQPGET